MTERRDFDWLQEFCCPERDEVDDWSSLGAEERERLERLDAEVYGLLPHTLDPVEPTNVCKESLMRRCAEQSPRARFGGVGPRRVAAPRWLLPLAAGLTALAVGYAVSMIGTVQRQQGELAQLRAEVERVGGFEAELEAARETMQLVSSRGIAICPLRPVREVGGEDGPYGLMFLAADHQHWYLRVAGLETVPDRYYRVWFETENGMVAAGNLAGLELELGSPTMPRGTRAVAVSVETEASPGAPSTDIVLYGDDMITVL